MRLFLGQGGALPKSRCYSISARKTRLFKPWEFSTRANLWVRENRETSIYG
jgi:hypothetical protein